MLRDAGIIVFAGFIVGFDNDDERVFDEQFDFIQRNGIAIALVSILSPIPTTPLYDRLAKEGRLVPDDEAVWFEPKHMSRETLKRGYQISTSASLRRRRFSSAYSVATRDRLLSENVATKWRPSQTRAFRRLIVGAYASFVMIWRLSRALAREGLLGTLGRAYRESLHGV